MTLNETDTHIVDAYAELMGFDGDREDIAGEAFDALLGMCDYEYQMEDTIIEQLGSTVVFSGADDFVERYFDWSAWARDVLIESQFITTPNGTFLFMHI